MLLSEKIKVLFSQNNQFLSIKIILKLVDISAFNLYSAFFQCNRYNNRTELSSIEHYSAYAIECTIECYST